jgi:hypothetical protein
LVDAHDHEIGMLIRVRFETADVPLKSVEQHAATTSLGFAGGRAGRLRSLHTFTSIAVCGDEIGWSALPILASPLQ